MLATGANAVVLNDEAFQAGGPLASYGNAQNFNDDTKLYPNVAALRGGVGPCTGSLINSRTVITAAHCFFDTNNAFDATPGGYVSFAPIAMSPNVDAANARFVTSIIRHQGYANGQVNDIAFVTLDRPMTSITPVQLLGANAAIPAAGTKIFMAGYGGYGTGTNPPNTAGPQNENRRYAESNLGEYGLSYNANQLFFSAQFRNPQTPNSPNTFNLAAQPGTLEGGVAQGDSGGPLFAIINGQRVQIGVVQGGDNTVPGGQTNGYGEISGWTPVNIFADWIAQNNPLRSVSAAAGNFNWSNSAAWVDAVAGAINQTPNNTAGAVNNLETDTARYYQVILSNRGTVTLDQNATVDVLSVSGASTQLTLPATFTLTTVLAAQLSAGAITMTGGTLTAPELLISGGLFQGNGTINASGGTTNVCNTGVCNIGGIVAPIGTITLNGNYAQSAGGALLTRLFVNGTNDRLVISGNASLGGTFIGALQPGLYANSTTYQVVTAGAVTRQFDSVAMQGSAFLTPNLTYRANGVDVTLTRTAFGAVNGLNANQQAVGRALEPSYSTTLTGAAATFYSALLTASSTTALSQISGATTAATQTTAFANGSQVSSMLMDQVSLWRDGPAGGSAAGATPLGYAPTEVAAKPSALDAFASIRTPSVRERTWRGWTSGFGGAQSLNADTIGAAGNINQNVSGGAIGADYQVDRSLLLGFAAGGSTSSFSSGFGSGRADGGFLGLYGVKTFGTAYLAGTLTYGRADNTINRTVAFAGESINGRFWNDQVGGRAEFGRRFAFNGYGVTPFAAVQYARLWQPGYTETSVAAGGGPGVFGLTYQSQSTESLPTFVGIQADTSVLINQALWSPFVRVSWVHEWKPATQVSASFVTIPGASFTVEGPRAARDAFRIDSGSTVALTQTVSLFGKVSAELSDRSQSIAGNGGLRVSW